MEFPRNNPEELKEAIDLVVYKTGISPDTDELKPAVLVETSYTAVSFPTVTLAVNNYLDEKMVEEAFKTFI